MSDLIDRQAAIDALLHNQKVYSNNFGTDAIDKYTIAIIDNDAQTIAQLPSAQPEIVRCKDCVHYDLAINGYNGNCTRQYATFYADDFCSYGER